MSDIRINWTKIEMANGTGTLEYFVSADGSTWIKMDPPYDLGDVVLDFSMSGNYWERIDRKWPDWKRQKMRSAHLERKRRRQRGKP